MATAGEYVPESMLIRLEAGMQLFDRSIVDPQDPAAEKDDASAAAKPINPVEEESQEPPEEQPKIPPSHFGFFFHEYLHFLHNISTPSGLVTLINQVDLWRCFRLTMNPNGFSQGSDRLDSSTLAHVRTLSAYLQAMRSGEVHSKLNYVFTPVRINISEVKPLTDVASATETLLTKLVCVSVVYDRDDNEEGCTVEVKTHEIVEFIASRLEQRLVRALDPDAPIDTPRLFPYRVLEALARCMVPDIDEEVILYCAMASLQRSNAPAALHELLVRVQGMSKLTPAQKLESLRTEAARATTESAGTLEASFRKLEAEFDGQNRLARALRLVISVSRKALGLRASDPFVELGLIENFASHPFISALLVRDIPCAVLQRRDGPFERLGRDILVSFREEPAPGTDDPEEALRILHSLFHFLLAHMRAGEGFELTERISAPCPFYTCCCLPLRMADSQLCRKTPWKAADGHEGRAPESLCWYGVGVHLTRPPKPPQSTSGESSQPASS
jgi:hypothetical protein